MPAATAAAKPSRTPSSMAALLDCCEGSGCAAAAGRSGHSSEIAQAYAPLKIIRPAITITLPNSKLSPIPASGAANSGPAALSYDVCLA